MLPDVPLLLQALTGLAVLMLVAGAIWPPSNSFAVRWPAVTASALFFGFSLSSALRSEMMDNVSLILIVSSLIFLSVTSLLIITSQSVDDVTPEDKEHQQ